MNRFVAVAVICIGALIGFQCATSEAQSVPKPVGGCKAGKECFASSFTATGVAGGVCYEGGSYDQCRSTIYGEDDKLLYRTQAHEFDTTTPHGDVVVKMFDGGIHTPGPSSFTSPDAGTAVTISANNQALRIVGTVAESNLIQLVGTAARIGWSANGCNVGASYAGTVSTNCPFEVYGNVLATNGGFQPYRIALPTCNSSNESLIRSDVLAGASTGNVTRICYCKSNGSATYVWRNMVSGNDGTSTTCPD